MKIFAPSAVGLRCLHNVFEGVLARSAQGQDLGNPVIEGLPQTPSRGRLRPPHPLRTRWRVSGLDSLRWHMVGQWVLLPQE
jgi:hypothetical protein